MKKESIKANNKYMQIAIDEAFYGISHKHGGPFGCVIVKDDKIISKGHNMVVANNDPTCHGEISAIRSAGKKMKSFDLSDCDLYTTGEPCPMCLCACMWANIKNIYYGCTIKDNEEIGFRDDKFDKALGGRKNIGNYLTCIDRDACLELFKAYNNMDKSIY